MSKLGKKLIKAAKEGRAIARGEADPATYKVFVPAKIDVKAIRAKTGLTQEEFCFRYALAWQACTIGSRAASRRTLPRARI
jgi:putative transcriptional regulator